VVNGPIGEFKNLADPKAMAPRRDHLKLVSNNPAPVKAKAKAAKKAPMKASAKKPARKAKPAAKAKARKAPAKKRKAA
jgi:hypothetical protein